MRINKQNLTANQKQNNNTLKTVQFYSVFQEIVPHVAYFWHLVEPSNFPEAQLTIFQGKLLNKNYESDKWEPFLFEMHPDRLFKRSLQSQSGDTMECAFLSGCFLRKFNHFDSNLPNYKFGFRLQIDKQLSFFVTDSAEQFKKWFIMLRRLCILDKFNRKYKIMSQLKYNDPIFGAVCYNCVKLTDASYYLVKIISKDIMNQQTQKKDMFFKELHNLRRLNHPQLMRLLETYEDEINIYQVFDQYMGGDLRMYLRESQMAMYSEFTSTFADERFLAEVIYSLIGAVQYMHSKGVFHRDIKLDNIFVPENRRLPFVVLTNFCYSETFPLNPDFQNPVSYKKIGTPGYAAPEIFKTNLYDQKTDMFSLGVIFYKLVFDQMPFEGIDQQEVLKANERCEIDFKAEKRNCKKISASGIELMKQMLAKDPSKRISSLQALNHHWFIKTKIKEGHRQNKPGRERSLSTIVENSEFDINNSFFNVGSRHTGLGYNQQSRNSLSPAVQQPNIIRSQKSQQTQPALSPSLLNTIVDIVDNEFIDGNMEIKIQALTFFKKEIIPSRKRYCKNTNIQIKISPINSEKQVQL